MSATWLHGRWLDQSSSLRISEMSLRDVHKVHLLCLRYCPSCSLLQEVRRGIPWWNDPVRVRHRAEQFRVSFVRVVNREYCRDVAAAVAVVGRWPHGNQLLIKHVLVTCTTLAAPPDEYDWTIHARQECSPMSNFLTTCYQTYTRFRKVMTFLSLITQSKLNRF